MNVRVYRTAGEAARAAASIVADRLDRQPAAVLGLPTGRTSRGIYDELARLHATGAVDFSRARSFNVDEFVGLPPNDRRSFRAFMQKHLFRRINLPKDRIHFLDGHAEDLAGECEEFERRIAEAGGIDLLLLGVGENGHIGFNEPGVALHARSHRARLRLETRRANADLFGGRVSAVPREALTMGVGTLLDARAIVLVATGKAKARAVASLLTGRITTARPASLLQLHHRVEVILDSAAAGKRFPDRTA
ncbi:MAG: glucosamine-6-phosphate deaminase [Vicinamibacterales bacterium]|nr:glucosamine-6-phosphate deaminase [Vicinamibacterales bacterium]